MAFQTIGFIGLGLIGGSIAKKMKSNQPDIKIYATAHHKETIQEAGGKSTNKGFYFAVFEFLNKQITKFVSHFFLHCFQLNNAHPAKICGVLGITDRRSVCSTKSKLRWMT